MDAVKGMTDILYAQNDGTRLEKSLKPLSVQETVFIV